MKLVPSGIKTHYQKEIEKLVAFELLESSSKEKNAFVERLKNDAKPEDFKIDESEIRFEFKMELDKFSAAQAMMTDLTGSALTIFFGWMFFNDHSLGILGISRRIAQKIAQRRAASHFFLGHDLGTAFYKALPPTPTSKELWIASGLVILLLTLLSLLVSLMIDPFRKRFGLQQKRFHLLLDQLEQSLFLYGKRKLKEAHQKP